MILKFVVTAAILAAHLPVGNAPSQKLEFAEEIDPLNPQPLPPISGDEMELLS